MDKEIKRDRAPRSPKSPKSSLADSIDRVREVYKKAGKAPLKQEILASALGYTGINGTSLTAIATLRQYGLLDANGDLLSVSPLALRLLHPLNDDQLLKSRREAALLPPIFATLNSDGYHLADEEVIANHLIQSGFAPEGAKTVARVFKENIEFAKLNDQSNVSTGDELYSSDKVAQSAEHIRDFEEFQRNARTEISGLLESYSIPLGANKATLTFHGKTLASEDFDALAEFVEFAKKQFERKQKSIQQAGIKHEGGIIPA